ncbi:copper amine oxidase N-terminal domain-containing protein [Cellulosilyticum ruminicola]|uniref:copper amine oxidase N-terminal domain-containing protein n=1 Tax=Cellulosilyticum ruminicola TaxID=425254 RepID=UPI0006D19E69|nr:copper amine oxidase N-terminal domain-containing protein [Cellulosilyticum ruminicola]
MKKKLTSILLLGTLAFGSSYTFAEETNAVNMMEQEGSNDKEEVGEEKAEYEGLDVYDVKSIEDLQQESIETITSGTATEVVLTLNSKVAYVNGSKEQLLNPPMVVNNHTFLPLRFVADEIVGGEVEWDEQIQRVTVRKGDQELVVTIGSKIAMVNGSYVNLEAAPFTKNGTTMLPVRFICESFGITSDYNKAAKQIILTGVDNRPNTAPSAYFHFGQANFTEGQSVKVIDGSTDLEHDKIVERKWKISGDMNWSGSDINSKLKAPKAGTYTVALQVKDKRGLWSQWYERELTVEPNKAPIVTFLEPYKATYSQGENIKLTYSYDNESWEKIINEKWTYRHAEEPENKAILGKPKALFTEGEYIITLQLDDEAGNRSEKMETKIHISSDVLKSELMYRFTEGSIGEVIDNFQKVNYRDYADAYVSETGKILGTMIMSDSPEVVSRDGLLYRDIINGKGRMLIHHLNGYKVSNVSGDNRRLVVVAENTTDKPVKVIITNKSVKGPATDILRIGQKVLYDYLVGSEKEVYTLQPGERKFVYDSKAGKWTYGQCISGLMDIETTGSVKFTTASVKHGVTLQDMVSMELLQQDVHPRGTFDTTELTYKLTLLGDQPTKLLLGTGTEEWVNGHDAITGEIVQNRGNFGVTYRVTVSSAVDTGVILNPRATNFRGAIKWLDTGKVYNIPETGAFTADTSKAAVLGIIKAGQTRTFEYMLPNGSAAPVLIGFIPKDYWNN